MELKKKYYLPLLREQGKEIKENGYHQLQALGRKILTEGYSFDTFSESVTLFWRFVFKENIHFEPKNLAFVQRRTLRRIYRGDLSLYQEQKEIYPLLPECLRQRYTLNDVVARYEQSIEASYYWRRGRSITGLYRPQQDKCYILATAGREVKSSTIVHELTHRQVHHQRQENEARKGIRYDHEQEESFCRDVENTYIDLVFYRDQTRFQRERKELQERYRKCLQSLTPRRERQQRKERIEFYKDLLWGRRAV